MSKATIRQVGTLDHSASSGLQCIVVTSTVPPLPGSVLQAARQLASTDDLLTDGDFVVHLEHGVARYQGTKVMKLSSSAPPTAFLSLQFAGDERLFVPLERAFLVQKSSIQSGLKLDSLSGSPDGAVVRYVLEVLPDSYSWPTLRAFPKLPQEWTSSSAAQWRAEVHDYFERLHTDSSYGHEAQSFVDRQCDSPQPFFKWWVYRFNVVEVAGQSEWEGDPQMLIKAWVLRRERQASRLKQEVESLERRSAEIDVGREPIPESVRMYVWQRDQGKCVRCGERAKLEFDHIIPVARGGSSTERNLQLLCEFCNRSKGTSV